VVKQLVEWDADNDKLRLMKSTQDKLAINIAKDDQVKWAFNRK